MAKGGREGTGVSLGEYTASLSAGSRCFCCDKPLTLVKGEPGAEWGGKAPHRLTCPYCGAEVERMEGLAGVTGSVQLTRTDPQHDTPEEPVEKHAASDAARNAA